MANHHDKMVELAAYLAQRRAAVMAAWRSRVAHDPKLTAGTALPRIQLDDHLPALLQDFERRLAAGDPQARAEAADGQKADAAAHGLHRWQQGFDLSEVSRELGRLNECVVAELDECAVLHPGFGHELMAQARAIWAAQYSVAIGSSVARYFELQQLEAAGHVAELEQAMHSLRQLEAQRAELWQRAAHDLRGNLGVIVTATAGLASSKASFDAREKFLGFLDRNVRTLHRLLEDVTSLARLQGGQEIRTVAEMDASSVFRDMAEGVQALADERKLRLTFDGPATLIIDGDAIKIRRIVQNLLLNAIKYTRQGGVSVNWGLSGEADTDRWFVQVSDTGPGFHAGPGAPLVGALGVATDLGKEITADETSDTATNSRRAQATGRTAPTDTRAVLQQEGEGLGLSIVKQLCGLLDAAIEVDSTVGQGTVFRVLLPRQYAN